jgi:thiosulfate/3-mercaptopyruvate sulfurtransferase
MSSTIVSADTLAQHLTDPEWIIVDCRFRLSDPAAGRRAYDAGHIPRSRYADLDRDLSAPKTPATGRHPLPDARGLAKTLGAWGIDATKQVIAYDDAQGAIAARLWWLLRWLGHERVAVLDGGLLSWNQRGGAMETATPRIEPAEFHARPDDSAWIGADFISQRLGRSDWLLLDARSEIRFEGEQEPFDPVKGHIPGAVNRPFEDNLDPAGRFLSPEKLRLAYSDLFRGSPGDVVHMCGSGVTACHNLLAMEVAGLHGSRLYPGSWSEWIRDPRRPIVTGP